MCETLPESDMNFKETELTLGLPGVCRVPAGAMFGNSTGFSEPVEDKEGTASAASAVERVVAGWPPVRACRKNVMKSSGTYVKVAVDGAPYLRKVDLETHGSYEQLLRALEDLFSCLTIRYSMEGRKIVDSVNGVEYVPIYEDRDGDWMMVGDVPWKMFVESCRRLRLMKSAEAVGVDLRAGGESTSNSC